MDAALSFCYIEKQYKFCKNLTVRLSLLLICTYIVLSTSGFIQILYKVCKVECGIKRDTRALFDIIPR